MIFDRNLKRATYLQKRDPVRHADEIARLRASPFWYVRYWKNAVPHDERCPDEYQASREAARKYYKIVAGQIESARHTDTPVRLATVADMCDFFLLQKTKKIGRGQSCGGYGAAKTHCEHIKRDSIASATFGACRESPAVLADYIDSLPTLRPHWSQKTIWNHYKILRAVFACWIKRNLIESRNPLDAVDVPEQGTAVIEYVPTDDDYQRMIATGIVEGVRLDALRLIGAVRYTGFRVAEVLGWQVEDVVLDPPDGLPFVWVVISKQRRQARVPRPIRAELVQILREQIEDRPAGPVWPWADPPYKLLRTADGRTLIEAAGVAIPRPFHDFRKLVKLELKRTGIGPKQAQAYQGHATESMDDYYTWWQRDDLEAAVIESYRKTDHGHDRGHK